MTVTISHGCRDEILRHFLEGAPLSDAAREHYLGCPACVAVVTERLSQIVVADVSVAQGNEGHRKGVAGQSEEARLALARAREMLSREFGIHRNQG